MTSSSEYENEPFEERMRRVQVFLQKSRKAHDYFLRIFFIVVGSSYYELKSGICAHAFNLVLISTDPSAQLFNS